MSYQIILYIYPVLCPCIALPFTSTLGGGNVKTYFIIVQPNLAHNLYLLGILGFTILLPRGGINLERISRAHRIRHTQYFQHKNQARIPRNQMSVFRLCKEPYGRCILHVKSMHENYHTKLWHNMDK